MSLSDLVAASGRNKRARAVQFFRDGLSFLSKDDCEKALPYFEKAVESDTTYADAWAQAGFCNEKLGKHGEALEASKKAVTLRPSAESFSTSARKFLPQAVSRSSGRLSSSNKTRSIQRRRCSLRIRTRVSRLGKSDEEIQAYKQAIRLRPDLHKRVRTFGHALHAIKEVHGAVELFRQLIALKREMQLRQTIWVRRISS